MQFLADDYAVGPQILPSDVATLAGQGFRTVICNRPDGEEPDQPLAAALSAACEEHDLAFHYLPFDAKQITKELVDGFREALAASEGPVFAYCRTGQRSAFIWSAADEAGT